MSDLICISHLRWDDMQHQRQYLPSRLSRHRRMLYIEPPLCQDGTFAPFLEIIPAQSDLPTKINIARLIYPFAHQDCPRYEDSATYAIAQPLIAAFLDSQAYKNIMLWIYTPMALAYTDAIAHKLLVYDAIEQDTAYKQAALQRFQDYEQKLLDKANIVIYRRRQPLNIAV